jgi:hypothetical protein
VWEKKEGDGGEASSKETTHKEHNTTTLGYRSLSDDRTQTSD